MNAYDFEAVAYNGEVYCTDCFTNTTGLTLEDADPVFADSEWDSYPVCDVCGHEHDYVTLLNPLTESYSDEPQPDAVLGFYERMSRVAVRCGGKTYCFTCMPEDATEASATIIGPEDEFWYPVICCACNKSHSYMKVKNDLDAYNSPA